MELRVKIHAKAHRRVKGYRLFVDSGQLVGPLHKCSTISVM